MSCPHTHVRMLWTGEGRFVPVSEALAAAVMERAVDQVAPIFFELNEESRERFGHDTPASPLDVLEFLARRN